MFNAILGFACLAKPFLVDEKETQVYNITMEKFKSKKGLIASILVIVLFIFFVVEQGVIQTANNTNAKYTANFLDVFDTSTDITVYANSDEEAEREFKIIKEKLDHYNKLFDIYNDYEGINNLKTINDNAGISPVQVDSDIIEMLKFGKEMYELTDGKVNIAMGSVLSIWHDYREYGINNPGDASLPDLGELNAAKEHTDINDVIIDEKESSVYLKDEKMSLDVGSIAKGYAVQQVLQFCKEQGMENVLFSVGGNIAAIGKKPDGANFKIAIQNPNLNSQEPYVRTVEISDGQSVVSSGDYQRYYEVDGKKYCHIINPDTLFPSDEFAQVSVLASDSGLADGLSTALFNMSYEAGNALINNLENTEAMWVYHDGTIVYSKHFEENIVN